MLHAEFQDHRTFDSGEDFLLGFYHIWACGGHLGFSLLGRMKVCIKVPGHTTKMAITRPYMVKTHRIKSPHEDEVWICKRFQRRKCLKKNAIYMYIAPGPGEDNALGVKTVFSIKDLYPCIFNIIR